MRSISRLLAVTALASLAVVPAAKAVLIVSGSVGGAPVGATNYVNFDSLALGSGGGTAGGLAISFSGDAAVVTGAVSGKYAAPFLSNGNGALFGTANGVDTTRYLSTGIGTVTMEMVGSMNYLGLLWGSVDSYNSLQFFAGNTLLGTVTGSDVIASPNGNQGVNGTVYVNITSDIAFNRVVALSNGYAFEFDNVAYTSAGPGPGGAGDPVSAPATLALFGAALAGLSFARRRSRA